MTVGLVTLPAAKSQLNIEADDTSDDLELQLYIDAVTAPIERELGTVVEQRTVVDTFNFAKGTTSFLLRSVPVASLASISAVDGSTTWPVDASAMHVDSDTGLVTVLSGAALTGLVAVSYTAGPAQVPANVRLAAMIVLQHLWETQRGRTGAVAGGGDLVIPAGYAVPNRAIELLGTNLPGVA